MYILCKELNDSVVNVDGADTSNVYSCWTDYSCYWPTLYC